MRTVQNIDTVEELVLSQEGKPQPHQSVREIARETKISQSSVHNIVQKDLQLKALKKKRAHEISAANKCTRLVLCKQLLCKFPQHDIDFVWFTDKKLFTVASPVNSQNDCVYVPVGTKKQKLQLRDCCTLGKGFLAH